MKLKSFLIVLIFNWIIWTFVKTVSIRKSLARQAEKDYTSNDFNKILNDGAESSVNPQIQKYKKTLKPKLKITKKDTDKGEDKVFNKSEYKKEYYQKNKEKLKEYNRNYIKNNTQYMSIYYQNNKEKIRDRKKIYYQNNKEKLKEYQRKYDNQKKKNVQSDNNEGTSFANHQTGDHPQTGDLTSKGKLPIVCEEEVNLSNQGEEVDNNGEENLIEVEDPNKILGDDINQIDSNKKNFHFDLNMMPEDEEVED